MTRADGETALFISSKAPYNRLKINGIQKILRKLGKETEIAKVHPHRFRRTLATMAIDKGMPMVKDVVKKCSPARRLHAENMWSACGGAFCV